MASAQENGLIVIASNDAPEIDELKGLPQELPILAIGRTPEEIGVSLLAQSRVTLRTRHNFAHCCLVAC